MASTNAAHEDSAAGKTPEWLQLDNKDGADGDPEKNNAFANDEVFAPETEMAKPTAALDVDKNTAEDTVVAADANPSSPRKGCCKQITICTLSFLFLALFTYSTTVQNDDPDSIQWQLFYGLHTGIPALFLINTFCCRSKLRILDKMLYALSFTMAIWSIVFIALISQDLSKILKEDEIDADMREEYIFELAGVCLGFCSVVYHTILTKYVAVKSSSGEKDGGECT